jgi:hypothetical protein
MQSFGDPLGTNRVHHPSSRLTNTSAPKHSAPAFIPPTHQEIPTTMAKLIVVCGATGGLGGAVARRMLSEGWRVRGITRNKDSAGAKILIEAGAELASAN